MKSLKSKLVKNWHKAYKSLAVIFPTVVVLIPTVLNFFIKSDYVDSNTAEVINTALSTDSIGLAVAVFVLSFIGRVIRQPKIGVK